MKWAITLSPDGLTGMQQVGDNQPAIPHEVGRQATQPPADFVWDGTQARAKNAAELLEIARTEKLAKLKSLRDEVQFDAYQWPADTGPWYNSDSYSRINIVGKGLAAAALRLELPMLFIDADSGVQTFADHDAVLEWASALDAFVSKCYGTYAQLVGQITTAPDPATVSIVSGWPVTRIDLSKYA